MAVSSITAAAQRPQLEYATDRDYLHALMANYDEVKLPAGAVYEIHEQLVIPGSTRLWSDPTNSATLKRVGDCLHICAVNGKHIQIENVQFDWNFGGVWREFHVCIGFAVHSWLIGPTPGKFTLEPLGNIKIIGCRFIDASGYVPHKVVAPNHGDSWAISLIPAETDQNIDNVKVLGCYKSYGDTQLTANGTLSGTWSNVEIAYNYVAAGWATCLGFTSRRRATDAAPATIFDGINIHHNILRQGQGYGISLGVDGTGYPDTMVQLNNINISDNLFELRKGMQFPNCVALNVGNAGGYSCHAVMRRNIFSVRDNERFLRDDGSTNSPRLISSAPVSPGSTLVMEDNIIHARNGRNNVNANYTVTHSGNVYLDGTPWTYKN